MIKPIVELPCTARKLENALHAVCDHDGLWDAKVITSHDLYLAIETEAKEGGSDAATNRRAQDRRGK